MDTSAIHKLYMGGEFDQAMTLLEKALRAKVGLGHGDSVFAFKHLGVMYSADYKTRETGKMYMFMLLAIEPTAKITDLYASDMIYMIFKNVQEEYEFARGEGKLSERAPGVSQADTSRGNFAPAPQSGDPGASRKRKWLYWTAGTATLAIGAGIASFMYLEESPSAPVRRLKVE